MKEEMLWLISGISRILREMHYTGISDGRTEELRRQKILETKGRAYAGTAHCVKRPVRKFLTNKGR